MITWEFTATFIQASMIFLLAATGELVNQRAGVLNVGLEGLMLVGALSAFIIAEITGSAWLGFVGGMVSGGMVGLLHGFLSISLKADQTVSGMGMWILALGMTTYLGQPLSGPLRIDGRLESVVGGLTPMFFIGIVIVCAVWYGLFRTKYGLWIRSAGEDPSVAVVSGLNVKRIRYGCVIFGGIMGGLAGAYLTLVYNPVWSPNPTMGRGWIALAIVFFSMWRPEIMLLGSFLFGLLWHLAISPNALQFLNLNLSYHFYRMIPFIATIVVLTIISSQKISRHIGADKPAALGKPYFDED